MFSEVSLSLFQECLLVLSNLTILPSVFVAFYSGFYAESALLFLLMSSSSFYHFCDGEKIHLCVLDYRTLQFLDFYSAIYSIWCISIILAAVPQNWRSFYHITGAVILGGLLTNYSVGITTFVVPLLAIGILLIFHWIYFYRQYRRLPIKLLTIRTSIAAMFILFGIACFAIQQNDGLIKYYGFIHSLWHSCMAFALFCLLPSTQNQTAYNIKSSRDEHSCDAIITEKSRNILKAPSLEQFNNTERSLNCTKQNICENDKNEKNKKIGCGHSVKNNNGMHSYLEMSTFYGIIRTMFIHMNGSNSFKKHDHTNLAV